MNEPQPYWRTAVSHVQPNFITIRGYPLDELVGKISYTEAIVLCLRGELPDALERHCINAVLTSALDHQFVNATALATRMVVSANPDPIAGMAAGMLGFGRVSAGVPGLVIELLHRMRELVAASDSIEAAADSAVQEVLDRGELVPGIGHPMHTLVDEHYTWRSRALRDEVLAAGLPSDGCLALYEAIHDAVLRRRPRAIPINVDGVIGAVLAELGYTRLEATALAPFTLLPGLAAHAVEEILEGPPIRTVEGAYVGLPVRHLRDTTEELPIHD